MEKSIGSNKAKANANVRANAGAKPRMTRKRRRQARLRKWGWGVAIVAALVIFIHHSANAHLAQAANGQMPASGLVGANGTSNQSTIGLHQMDYLERSFAATGAKQSGYLLHNWSTFNQQFTSVRNLSKIGEAIGQELGVHNAKITTANTAEETFFELDGTWSNHTDVSVVLSSFPGSSQVAHVVTNAGHTNGTTVLVISATSTSGSDKMAATQYQLIENTVTELGISPEISACLEGYLSDKIMGGQAKRIVSDAFQAVNAVPIGGLNSPLETSISGYSNEGLNYINSNGSRMNLQVAIHADSYYNHTNVLVGTPIITTTY